MSIKTIESGNVTTPKGYKAYGVASGIKKSGNLDLGILVSQVRCPTAGVYTTNQLKGASLIITQDHLSDGYAQAVIVNSGNANACTGERGLLDARELSRYLARKFDIPARDVLPSSTGVIGEYLPLSKMREGIDATVPQLSNETGNLFTQAMMTTDTVPKHTARKVILDGHCITLGGTAKGSGMIHPNMATMLAYVTTDARISSGNVKAFFKPAVDCSFNRLTIDGDMSCDDTVLLMANGLAGSTEIVPDTDLGNAFAEALNDLCRDLAKQMALDGEGVSRIARILVQGTKTKEDATAIARSIAVSPLVKTALCSGDPNWGRIVNAAGYSGAIFDPNLLSLHIGDIQVVKRGVRADFDEVDVAAIMQKEEVEIIVNLNAGIEEDFYLTTDLSQAYIEINADYRNRT